MLSAALADGHGQIRVRRGRGGSVVTSARARPPLSLVFPRNHGDAAWVFTSSLGGGLVGGDAVHLALDVGAGASCLITTQASSKVYRSPRASRQDTVAHVAAGGTLVVAPDPVACFAGSRFAQETRVELAAGASLILVEAMTAGRVAHGERWAFDGYRTLTEIRSAGTLALRDAVELSPEHGALASRMQRFDALATICAMGPAAERAPLELPSGDDVVAVSCPFPGGQRIRVATHSAQALHKALRQILVRLPQILGDDLFVRKW